MLSTHKHRHTRIQCSIGVHYIQYIRLYKRSTTLYLLQENNTIDHIETSFIPDFQLEMPAFVSAKSIFHFFTFYTFYSTMLMQ
jgi:hypothetical protein